MPQQISRLLRATSVRLHRLGIARSLLDCAHPSDVQAQTAGEGTITGTVTDTTAP